MHIYISVGRYMHIAIAFDETNYSTAYMFRSLVICLIVTIKEAATSY